MHLPSSCRSALLMGLLATLGTTATATWRLTEAEPDPAPVRVLRLGGLLPTTDDGTDRLIIKYRSGTPGNRRSILSVANDTHRTVTALGHTVSAMHRNAHGAQVLTLSRQLSLAEMQTLAQDVMANDPTVLYAEPDQKVQALLSPNDPLYPQQWHYFDPVGGLNLPAAWDLSTGSGVTVAVVDTGVRPHVDLSGQLLSGYDFVSSPSIANDGDGRDADATDPGDGCSSGHSSWHGTHVAGTIAALTNNGVGVAGVAHGAKILPVRVLGCGGGYNSDVADGLMWAAGATVSGAPANEHPAQVINLSLGSQGTCSTTMQAAIDAARARGAVVVVAAGNSNTSASNFSPASCKRVVTVAAVGPNGGRAPYSNYGTVVDVAAPGGNQARGWTSGVLSTLNTGTTSPGADSYEYYQGTSMATPHVAGVAALMLSRNPGLTPDGVEMLLKSTARAFPATCSGCGTGIVHAEKAVKAVFAGTSLARDLNEVEPNNTLALAQAISSLPSRVLGRIASTTDVDVYRVELNPGATLVARLIGNSSTDLNMDLRTATNLVRASSVKTAGSLDQLSWKNTGTTRTSYYVRVFRYSGTVGSPGGDYSLELALQ